MEGLEPDDWSASSASRWCSPPRRCSLFLLNGMVPAPLVPRYRYDQLMRLGWKVFLPTSLAAVAIMGAVRVYRTEPMIRTFAIVSPASSPLAQRLRRAYEGATPGTSRATPTTMRSRRRLMTPAPPRAGTFQLKQGGEAGPTSATTSACRRGWATEGRRADAGPDRPGAEGRGAQRLRRGVQAGLDLPGAPQGHHAVPARAQSAVAPASAASMRCAAIPTAKSVASPASSARRSAPPRRSPSRRKRARTAAGAPPATTSTWRSASTPACARRPAPWTPWWRGPTSGSPRDPRGNSTTTRSALLANGDRWEREIAKNLELDAPYR